jgi:hypothetical protein
VADLIDTLGEPMSLITINVEPSLFKRLLLVLERIASALERAYPDIAIGRMGEPAGPENLTVFDPEKEWEREQEEDRQRELGLQP